MKSVESKLRYIKWVIELVNQEYSGSFIRLGEAADRAELIVMEVD